MQLAKPVFQDIGKADQDGKIDAAQHERVDQLLEIDRDRRIFFRMHMHVPVIADRKISLAPARHVEELARDLSRPPLGRLDHHRPLTPVSFQYSALLRFQFPSKGRLSQAKVCYSPCLGSLLGIYKRTMNRYIAEFLGTFALALAVGVSL